MANPNIAALTTLTFDRDKGLLTITQATMVGEVASGTVEIIDKIALAGIATGTFSVNINHGTTQIFSSTQITGFTTELIDGPIVLKEGDYMTGNASANSSVNYLISKRVES